MAATTKGQPVPVKVSGGVAHRVARRRANAAKAASADPSTDSQGLVEFGCECTKTDCERSVKVPLYVYRRLIEAGDQYLLQAGHHAFASYRTIVTVGLMRIEERA
jgi:hypothetical protein